MASPSGGDAAAAAATAERLGEAAAEWSRSRWIDVDGHPVRYRDAGAGVPLVLVHGLGVSADYWVRNAAAVASAGYRVLAPDLPGFGRTDGADGGLGVPDQVEAVRRWEAAIGLGPAVYLGHSLSCQTVLQLAVDEPDAVLGLVLAAPTGDGPTARRLARQAVGLALDVPRESWKLAMFVAQAYLRAGPRRVFNTWWMGARHDPLPLLPRVRVPTLVILGERDPVVDRDFAERVAATLPAGRLVVVPHAAHAVIFEESGVFNRAVLGVMAEVGG